MTITMIVRPMCWYFIASSSSEWNSMFMLNLL